MGRIQLLVSTRSFLTVALSQLIPCSLDLSFWYDSAFGSPVGRIQGLGYIQELVSRLTHTPIEIYNSSTNSTLDGDETTFPLNDILYVDATHEVVVLNSRSHSHRNRCRLIVNAITQSLRR